MRWIGVGAIWGMGVGAVWGQAVPDRTLPVPSQVETVGAVTRIQGGTVAGPNLFHSFTRFGVPAGTTTHFAVDGAISRVIARVTGAEPSAIEGVLRVGGSADLFLLNPNGLRFGEGARLEIGGAMWAAAARAVTFADGFRWDTDTASPLLSVSVPTGLQMGTGAIAWVGANGVGSMTLVGADIALTDSRLRGPAVHLVATGTAPFFSLTETLGQANGNLILTRSQIDVRGAGGGRVTLRGGDIRLGDRSEIEASGQGSQNSQGVWIQGDRLTVSGSDIFVDVDRGGSGRGGDLVLDVGELRVQEGGQLSVSTYGAGAAGTLRFQGDRLEVVGTSPRGELASGLIAEVGDGASGAGGSIVLRAREVLLREGGFIATDILGTGRAGNVAIEARERIEVTGGPGSRSSFIAASIRGLGDGGDVTLQTPYLALREGGRIAVSTFLAGNSSRLQINANEIVLAGISPDGRFPSGLFASVAPGATGNGGEITVTTDRLSLSGGARIATDTNGGGRAGNLTVVAQEAIAVRDSLTLAGRTLRSAISADVGSQALGLSRGGNVTLRAPRITVDRGARISAATSALNPAPGGTIQLQADTLTLTDGGRISVSTFGPGAGGDIRLAVGTLQVQGIEGDRTASAITAQVEPTGRGNGGTLQLQAQTVQLAQGGQISTATFGGGNGGNLQLQAERLELGPPAGNIPSGLFSAVTPTAQGGGGTLHLTVDTLEMAPNSRLSVSDGAGQVGAGNLILTGQKLVVAGAIEAETRAGQRGNITVSAPLLLMRPGGLIQANAFGAASGGNLTVQTTNLVGFPPSNLTANAEGAGGKITVNTTGLFGFRTLSRPQIETLLGTNDLTRFNPFTDFPRNSNISAVSLGNPDPALSGTVQLNTPDTDPAAGLVELATAPLDRDRLILPTCPQDAQASSFVVTGRGGPITPSLGFPLADLGETPAPLSQNLRLPPTLASLRCRRLPTQP